MNEVGRNYRDSLREEFAARCDRNRHYSLRSFARDLDLRPSHLSEILSGKLGLSPKSAFHVANTLGMTEAERSYFVTSVEALHSRSPKRRKVAQERLATIVKPDEYKTLDDKVFEIISDWHHYAIMELVATSDFVPRLSWIAERLGVNRVEIELAVRRLKAVKLLQVRNGKWIISETFPATRSGVPSKSIKKFHSQIISKASEALYEQSVEKRDFSTMTFSINPDDLPEIKEELRVFRRALEKKYKARANKKEVYALSMQFFSLTVRPERFSNRRLPEVANG